MFCDKNMWSNKDGTKREKFIYVCGHYKRTGVGGSCNRNGIACEVIEEEVLNYTKKLLNNEEFASDVKSKIGNSIDSSEMDNEIQRIKKELSLVEKRKKNLENDIDNILNEDKHSKRKRMDLNKRLDQTYNKLDDLEDALAMAKEKKNCLRRSLNN